MSNIISTAISRILPPSYRVPVGPFILDPTSYDSKISAIQARSSSSISSGGGVWCVVAA